MTNEPWALSAVFFYDFTSRGVCGIIRGQIYMQGFKERS